jgi:ribonuclease HII
VIRGDEKISVISLASICAKVTRDRFMVKVSKKYPKYDFHIHKGYGTLGHRKMIKKHGVSVVHRKSFLKSSL